MAVSTYLLVIIEDTVSPERTGTNHMAIGQDVPTLCIHNKARSLAGHGEFRVERASLTEVNRNGTLHDFLNGSLPLRRICRSRGYSR
jgi:hypothetical protein